MDTHLLPIWDEIAEHDAKIDEQIKRIMTPQAPRKPKVVVTSPNGINSKSHTKPAAPSAKDTNESKQRQKRTSAEARRAALERKQF